MTSRHVPTSGWFFHATPTRYLQLKGRVQYRPEMIMGIDPLPYHELVSFHCQVMNSVLVAAQ